MRLLIKIGDAMTEEFCEIERFSHQFISESNSRYVFHKPDGGVIVLNINRYAPDEKDLRMFDAIADTPQTTDIKPYGVGP